MDAMHLFLQIVGAAFLFGLVICIPLAMVKFTMRILD